MDHSLKADAAPNADGPSQPTGLARREIRTCVTCGTKFSASGDRGVCPVCILLGSIGEGSTPAESVVQATGAEHSFAQRQPSSIAPRFEHYEVTLDQDGKPIELGRGAMGVTYKAFDVNLRFPVTLKLISEKYVGDQSARLRFLREARAAAKVRHSNVASVFHLGRSSWGYFYAMEFVEGETLESFIKRSGCVAVKLAMEIVMQVAAGLAAVHEQHLVHRDIKPNNIIVRLKDENHVTAKIIDLGLAKTVGGLASESAISEVGGFVGTPEFASPEQFAGVGVDIRSDLYSLGVTLWKMLTGQTPFCGTPTEMMYQHQHAPLPFERLKAFPEPVLILLQMLLEKDLAQRVQSPAELLKTMPMVVAAIEAGRSVSQHRLRASAGLRAPAFQKRPMGLGKAKVLPTNPKGRLFVWSLILLLMAAGLFLGTRAFLGTMRSDRKTSLAPATPLQVPEKGIAVLPFENLSADKSDTYFVDGIQDQILSDLARVSQLKVISRTSVMAYRSRGDRDVRSIASDLGIAFVVEGAVQKDGNRVRVTVHLIDAGTDRALWAESYQRDLTDIFAIQSDIAETVAAKLSARLTPKEQRDIGEKPTTSLEAYDLYLQAKEQFMNFEFMESDRDGPLKAIKFLEEAIRKDPEFTLAYCLLARFNDDLYHYWVDPTPERLALADAAMDEAIRQRSDLAEVHLAMAYHRYSCYRDYERALVHIAIAQRTLPNSPEGLWLTARIDRRQGRWEESTKVFEKAYSLDPRNPDILIHLGDNYCTLRRYLEAERTYDRLTAIQPNEPFYSNAQAYIAFRRTGDPTRYRAVLDGLPSSIKDHGYVASMVFWLSLYARDWAAAKELLAKSPDEDLYFGDNVKVAVPRGCGEIWVAALQGNRSKVENGFGEARNQLAQRAKARPTDPELLSGLGIIDAFLGRKQEAIQEATRAIEIRPISEDAVEGPFLVESLAVVYAWTNEPDLAFQEMSILIQTPLHPSTKNLKADPTWDPIRKDPRFNELVTKLALQE
jgi:serine/threonine protein kinase/tetratricopeptide (TPR) repeat protein